MGKTHSALAVSSVSVVSLKPQTESLQSFISYYDYMIKTRKSFEMWGLKNFEISSQVLNINKILYQHEPFAASEYFKNSHVAVAYCQHLYHKLSY